jgi:head-tail adaptor
MNRARNDSGRSTENRYRIKVLRIETRNVGGFVETTGTVIGEHWAGVTELSETLRTQYKTISVLATHAIVVGWKTDVKESDFILFNDRPFEIQTIKEMVDNGRYKLIITQEVRPGQEREA